MHQSPRSKQHPLEASYRLNMCPVKNQKHHESSSFLDYHTKKLEKTVGDRRVSHASSSNPGGGGMMMDTTRASMLERTIQQLVINTNESPPLMIDAATAKLSECSQCGMRFTEIERYLKHTRDKCAASQMIEKPTGVKHQVPPL